MERESGSRAWHNVRKNETTRLPRRYIFLDTEARNRKVKVGYEQTWRLGVGCFIVAEKGEKMRERWDDFDSPKELWEAVSAHCRKDSRTVLWAHNLGYDARISALFEHLPLLGWKLVAHNITPRGTWMEWKRDGATLIMSDSTTVFSTTIAKIGVWFGMGKVAMDMDSDDDELWRKRCRRDVEILRTAMLAYLEWIEEDDLGNWQLTGSGQSWATFRHRFLTHKMVVHDDERALIAERRAMWAGRCEAYWHGELRNQTVHEWDFTQAYARIARDNSVPVRLIGPMPEGYDWRRIMDSSQSALLATVEVETDVPVLPTHSDGRILWPVGRFTTTVWDVELKAAIEAGAKITVKEGWLYRLQPALREWAEWTIGLLDSDDKVCPAWRKSILKHWSRSLIGRMAMTYNSWEPFAESPFMKVERARLFDLDTKEEYDIMQIGNDLWRDAGRVESPHSMPMVTGYIQAIARVKLWNVIRALPTQVLLYVDTDSLLVTGANLNTVADIAREVAGDELRLKRSWDGFAIYGPRQIVTGAQVRASGIPTAAVKTGKREFLGEVWDSLPGSISRGHTDKVVIRGREWRITGSDRRRESIGIGWTKPYVLQS